MEPGFSSRPTSPQRPPLWPVLCLPTPRPSPWSPWLDAQVGTVWPSSLWPCSVREDCTGCWKATYFKMGTQTDSPRELLRGSGVHQTSPSSPRVDPLVPFPRLLTSTGGSSTSPAVGVGVSPSSPVHPRP